MTVHWSEPEPERPLTPAEQVVAEAEAFVAGLNRWSFPEADPIGDIRRWMERIRRDGYR